MRAPPPTHVDRLNLILAGLAAPMTAAGFILLGFVANDVPLTWLWRPLIISVVVAIGIEAALWVTLGPLRGSVWAFAAVSAIAGLFLVAGATLLLLFAFGLVRSRTDREYELVGLLAAAFSFIFIGYLAVSGLTTGAFDWRPTAGPPLDLGGTHPGPNIHLLQLDGYPRADVLAASGYDNGPFLDALSDRGFDVYDDSLSNYDLTPFSVLSILSADHIADIPGVQPRPSAVSVAQQSRVMTRALLDPPIFDALERAGYRTRLVTGDVVGVTIGGADVVMNSGSANNFELDALQRTPWAGLLEWFGFAAGQHRHHIEWTLDAFADAPESATFTFAHVLSPHAPFVYRADGSPAASPPCYPATCALYHPVAEGTGWSRDEYRARMIDHIRHLNVLVLDAIDRLIASDPDGVIVIFSDHGTSGEDELDRFRNLIVARTPGHPRLLGPAPTPVNILPRVLDAYIGADLEPLPDDLYRHGEGREWLTVERVSGE